MAAMVSENQRKAAEAIDGAVTERVGASVADLQPINLGVPIDPDLNAYLTPEASTGAKVVVLLSQLLRMVHRLGGGTTAPVVDSPVVTS